MKSPQKHTKPCTQLPHNLFGMDAFSFKTSCLKCIGEQFRDALNDQGRLGTIYKGLTKFLMAKYGGSTTLTKITIATCLHSPTTRTIALLIENDVQIKSFDQNFHATCTEIEQQWENRKHKLTIQQQANIQKLLYKLYTFNVYILNNITMPNRITLMNPKDFKKNTIHAPKT
jgi:disulfide oxidoreductase YuzD